MKNVYCFSQRKVFGPKRVCFLSGHALQSTKKSRTEQNDPHSLLVFYLFHNQKQVFHQNLLRFWCFLWIFPGKTHQKPTRKPLKPRPKAQATDRSTDNLRFGTRVHHRAWRITGRPSRHVRWGSLEWAEEAEPVFFFFLIVFLVFLVFSFLHFLHFFLFLVLFVWFLFFWFLVLVFFVFWVKKAFWRMIKVIF